MKRIAVVLLLIVAVVVGIGLWRGWFSVSSQHRDDAGKVDVNITVDEGKMREDAAAVKDEAGKLAGKVREEARELGGDKKSSDDNDLQP